MSSTGSFPVLLQSIEADLQAAGNWLETEALGGAEALWSVLKVAFLLVTSKQAQVIIDVYNRISYDETQGMSLEQMETDLLQTATADEVAILKDAGSIVIQGLLAFIRGAQMAKKAKEAAGK